MEKKVNFFVDKPGTEYSFNKEFGIYQRLASGAFAYSDGDAVESLIYKIISEVEDVSVGSEELAKYISDWPTLYHLSAERVNLVRPLEESLRGKKVLELGSGCGAISRFLAEAGCQLTCVEGSFRRAAITASRCRGLQNVKVYCDNFQDFETQEKFDVVTFIGVLEYSRKFIEGDDPIASALAIAKSFLKEGGVLIVAIENKLGLKYWAGAPEDHLGVPFCGVESLYGEKTAVTFGREELSGILKKASFDTVEYYYPFPDYKLPNLVVTDSGCADQWGLSKNLLSACFAPNQVANYSRTFAEGAAYRALVENGLVGDLANSFLVIAKSAGSDWPKNERDLAFVYSTSRRKPFRKETRIFLDDSGEPLVGRRLLHAENKHAWIDFQSEEPLVKGELLFNSLFDVVGRPGWRLNDLVAWARPFYEALVENLSPGTSNGLLPGHFFDATPFNLIVDGDKKQFIDLEWRPRQEVAFTVPLFRGVFYSLARLRNVAAPESGVPLLLAEICRLAIKALADEDVDVSALLAFEVEFQAAVSGSKASVEVLRSASLNIKTLDVFRPGSARVVEKRKVSSPWGETRRLKPVQKRLLKQWLAEQKKTSLGIVISSFGYDETNLEATLASLNAPELGLKAEVLVFTDRSVVGSLDERVRFISTTTGDFVASVNRELGMSDFDWVMIVEDGDQFTVGGLHALTVDLSGNPECDAVYGDALIGGDEDLSPLLRPDFNLDLLLSIPAAMARNWIFRKSRLLELGGFNPEFGGAFDFDYILRLIEVGGAGRIGHISEPLLICDAPGLQDKQLERDAIERHLRARGYSNPKVKSSLPGRYELDYGHSIAPKVSVLIVVKDRLAWIQRCMESLLEKTDYPNYEVILIDHGNSKPELRYWLDGMKDMQVDSLRVLQFDESVNRQQIRNQAASRAAGEFLLWLGDGAGILSEDWLRQLLNHALRPEVGAVGGKLISGDGLIRHAGGVLGLGGPVGRAFLGQRADSPGYMQRLQVDQNYSALSDLCLMVRRDLFIQLGGFSEDSKLSRWADADLCLRIQQAGFLNVWTPRAQLLMDEPPLSVASTEEEDMMYERWLPMLARDPAYNPNLALNDQQGFKLAPSHLTWKPLQGFSSVPVILAHNADAQGCGHYRIIQPLNALKEAGLIEGQLAGSYLNVAELERYNPDSIVLQRQISESQYELMRRMKAFSRAYKIFELDDYIPNLPLKSVHRASMPKDIVKSLRRALTCVDRFVVSTEPLAEAFSGLHGEIHVVKNRLDPRWWRGLHGERRVSKKPRVGWAGGSGHTGDLEMIIEVVKELAGEVEWVFFGMCPETLRPYVHELHPGVAIEEYPAALARLNLDLALAPLEENQFNECKSNLRLLEYGACGVPVVCSDLICYQGDLPVTRVRNRFKDWVSAIRMHLADLDATAKQGDALRAAVRRDWMLEGENLELWREAWLPA